MTVPKPLLSTDLCHAFDPATLPFASTAELEDLPGVLGQERALDAIRFATAMRHPGYNLFVLGAMGTGRHEVTRRFLEAQAAGEPVPDDLVYVHDFHAPEQPIAMRLPPGRAVGLRRELERLVEDLRVAIPAAFEANEYRTRRQALEQELKERQAGAFEAVREKALQQDIALIQTPTGIALAPIQGGEVLPPEAFEKLSEEERAAIGAKVSALHDELESVFRELPRWERQTRERVRALDREVTSFAVDHLLDDSRARYVDLPDVVGYLDAVQADVIEHADRFLPASPNPLGGALPRALLEGSEEQDPHRRYRVNVAVDRTGARGAPVIYEDQPTLQALVGRVDHLARMGALLTDHTLIRAGALHRANGGYLLLDAQKLLSQPMAWETLKRTLLAGEIRIESLGQALNLVSTLSLEPRPVPLSVKVALIGDPTLYYLLSIHDPEFGRLFKVPAEFEDRMVRDGDSAQLFCRMLATLARRDSLRPLDREAAARVLGEASRLAGDMDKLSTHIVALSDLLRAADHVAGAAGRAAITADDVRAAIAADEHRRGSLRDRLQEATANGTIRVETEGAVVGQVNGLAVLGLGGTLFGRPSRITARVWPGRGRVLDIEREVQLGGPLHSKGVLILSGFLGHRFGRSRPLALSASLVFEQSYSGVDGDSATLAETCALLSAIADVPLRQDIALTGSLDQRGNVQAIGGANEKVEGFFALCAARGLTGTQGVIVPRANVRHLHLRDEVVEAVAAGRFALWAVDTVDDALAILTGMAPGEQDAGGSWTPGTLNARVDERLVALAESVRRFSEGERGEPGASARERA